MKNILKKSLTILPWFIIVVAIALVIYFEAHKDVTFGRIHRVAYELFGYQEDVTKAEIYLLMGDDNQLKEETFPIRSNSSKTYGKVTLEGQTLKKFIELWEFQPISYHSQMLCHEPPYGFKLYEGSKLVGQTSICWSCSNFYVTIYPGVHAWYGFNARSTAAQELLNFCNERLPYKTKKK
ncbi:MAG: hypothetical protein NE330_18825 [Lentisphaeraceae bacterium]|nr:hypothetical protein [Lentisphaeraceae bacterium]